MRTFLNKPTTVSGSYGLAAAGASLLLAAANGHGQSLDNIYGGLAAGGSFQQEVPIQTGFNGTPGDMKFSAGWCLNGNVGYRFCPLFSTEIDCGVIGNGISTIGGQPLAGVATAQLTEVPVLFNGVFTYPVGHFKPYAGAGLGFAVGIFDSSGIPGSGPTFDSTDVSFAYQFEAGLKYSVSKNIDLGLAYRFVGTSSHRWSDDGIDLNTDGTKAHLLEATFTWRF